jgi:hypothetical protein
VVPRYAGIALDHDPALYRIARDLFFFVLNLYVDPTLYRIARDQNGIALDQLIKLWSHAV